MSHRTATAERTPVITEADYDRLNHLAESPRYRANYSLPLRSLKDHLSRWTVVPTTKVPKSVVTMHSEVRVSDPNGDDPETYTLVYPDAADITEGKLSVLAPMGRALLGARAGRVIEFEAPGGPRRLKVVKVLYQPEAAGDLHL